MASKTNEPTRGQHYLARLRASGPRGGNMLRTGLLALCGVFLVTGSVDAISNCKVKVKNTGEIRVTAKNCSPLH